MLRWGILSTAKIGREHLIPALLKANNGIITAIASRDAGRAAQVATQFAIPHAYGSYEELLASSEVDAIYIPLPTSQHVEWSIKAAEAGKHVLCEKPISLHASQIDDIIKARDSNGVIISEAFMVTHHPQWHKVRDLLAQEAIGKVQHVQASFTYYNRDPANMRNVPELGGGVLPDIGVYPTVTTRFATGAEPLRVSAKVIRDAQFGTDIHASARVDFGSFEMSMYISTQLALRQSMVFHGDSGWIELFAPFNAGLFDADTVRLHNADHSEVQQFRFAGVDQYQLQVEAFGRAALSGDEQDKEKLFSLEDSVKNQKLIDAIYTAGESENWETV